MHKHQSLTDDDHMLIDKMMKNDEIEKDMKQELLVMKNNGRKYQSEILMSLAGTGFRDFLAKMINKTVSEITHRTIEVTEEVDTISR